MGRKKKVPVVPEEDGFKIEDILHSDAKRSIAAVFLFALSLLFLLAYFNTAGVFGVWLDTGIGKMFGFGKWLLPILLITAGLMFLKRRTTTLADAVRFVGLIFAFFSVLGLFHLYSGDGTKELLKVARAGQGGGYIGFAFAYVLANFTGIVAGTIILLTLFVVGMIASFNVSLIESYEKLQARLRPQPKEGDGLDETVAVEGEIPLPLPDVAPAPAPIGESVDLAANNIRNIEFREDDKTVSNNLEIEGGSEETVLVPAFIRPRKVPKRRGYVHWELPPVDLLESTTGQAAGGDTERNKHIIQSTLKYFGIEVEPGEVRVGPTVTQYTFRPAFGVKLSRITTLSNDLALALAAQTIRIEAPIPGQALIGIEVPNKTVATVRLKAIIESKEFRERKSDLMMALGQDVAGKHMIADLRRMPHILIAGRTGSGKSVCINTFLLSLLYQNSPEDLKLILVDPKRVELAMYRGIPHLQTDVIVDMKKVVNALRWAVGEMEHRYKVLEEVHARDIVSYRERALLGEHKTVVNAETSKVTKEPFQSMPYLVIVIDEMADLMSMHGKEVEALINRLAAKSRAIGIHLLLATQRPEVTVITGLIKSNIPTRIAFQLKSQIDSRTILAAGGAEKLLGNGDMLYSPSEGTELKRIQGVFVSDDEVKRVTTFLRNQKEEKGEDEIGGDLDANGGPVDITEAIDALDEGSKDDALYEQAKELTLESGRASTTSFQTAFSVGYPRAARLMRLLEENGVVGMVDGKKTVLMSKAEGLQSGSAEEQKKQYGDDPLSDQGEREKWQL
jgi:S-DNA-T family DNA segregation ATPase FtsK/SpoIIIE